VDVAEGVAPVPVGRTDHTGFGALFGRQQPKVSNSVTIVIQDMLGQHCDKICDRVPLLDHTFLSEILRPKLHFVFADFHKASLRNRRSTNIPTGVSKEMCLELSFRQF
jgi:hypothetical protein